MSGNLTAIYGSAANIAKRSASNYGGAGGNYGGAGGKEGAVGRNYGGVGNSALNVASK